MIKNSEKGKRILTSTINPKKKRIGHRYTGIVSLKDNIYWKSADEGKNAYYPFLGDENFDKVSKEIKK